eukprot:Gregarina_sp_Poly_1__10751@NODE_81_length_15589_cov_30_056114_g69_i0_p4_GENE_NODE_81_length_15589_cov_30_056114_g69_i0NODE_81_length_15589_cov_30_056114_g69_i0_p4_ORF_typecomplete_len209_score32_21Fboxlike/PF12937_7/0_0029NESP55/PF06390_12/0_26_NODE_81_length_15589_cov_30_056114_g69_i01285313479
MVIARDAARFRFTSSRPSSMLRVDRVSISRFGTKNCHMPAVWFEGFLSPSPLNPSPSPPTLNAHGRRPVAIGTLKHGAISAREVLLSSVQAENSLRSHAALSPLVSLSQTSQQWRLLVLSTTCTWGSIFGRTRFLETIGEGKHAACFIVTANQSDSHTPMDTETPSSADPETETLSSADAETETQVTKPINPDTTNNAAYSVLSEARL